LKTPLTTIKGLAQVLARRAAQAATPEMASFVEGLAALDAAATRMRVLISQLLDEALLQAGQSFSLDLQAASLAALARRVVEEHHEAVARVAIRVETPPPEPWGRWDVLRIERVIANLLSNAVKYSPNGGDVTITVCQEQPEDESPGWAVLTMRDQGVGIPPAELPRIFERFFRGSNVSEQVSGTGIGLAGVRPIVEQHGGTIAVDSALGAGTTFTLRLPLDAEAEVLGYAMTSRDPS
jgi:signal transduction histidine kinase